MLHAGWPEILTILMRRVTRPSASAELARSATARPSANRPPRAKLKKSGSSIHYLPPRAARLSLPASTARSAPPSASGRRRAPSLGRPPPRAAPQAAVALAGGREDRAGRLSLPASTARGALPPARAAAARRASGGRHRAPRLRRPSRSPEAGKRPANPLGFLGFWPPRASSTEPAHPRVSAVLRRASR
ncbi:hypothetical protein GUJ93_ZPchr0012g21328 [Zizania palustris]|uniref:Uncharacterized protein n=1 Tax=Zizania palustris TaxID=103762 RepID=A0A8J5WV46_ZIZPA|nr:hypothetical protein GUJ93_ZPchr0012g21328 [Zizania palustris]